MSTNNGADELRSGAPQALIQIDGLSPEKHWIPSRFNARTRPPDGALVLYNSLTGAFSGFQGETAEAVLVFLHKAGTRAHLSGVAKYLHQRGFIVERGTDELARFRFRYGDMQYRRDRLEFILLASEECNFRCVYCYETFPRGTMEPWVRGAVVTLVERRARTLNALSVAWFGGEPLLGYDAIAEVAPALQRIAKANDISYGSHMTTNGYLLDEDKFNRLLEWNVTSYQITLDGTSDAHDEKRPLKGGGPSFDVILRNLRGMSRSRARFVVTLRINFDRRNRNDLADFMDLLRHEFGSDERFQLRFYPVGKWGGTNDDSLEVCDQSLANTYDLQMAAAAKGLNVESKLSFMQPHTGQGVCYAARPYNLIIGADGKIMKCTIALDTKDYNIVGHITRDGRAEIDIDKLSRWVTPYYEGDTGCRECFYLPVCQGCSCPLVRIEEDARPCPSEKTHIGSELRHMWALNKHTANTYDVAKEELSHHSNDKV